MRNPTDTLSVNHSSAIGAQDEEPALQPDGESRQRKSALLSALPVSRVARAAQ